MSAACSNFRRVFGWARRMTLLNPHNCVLCDLSGLAIVECGVRPSVRLANCWVVYKRGGWRVKYVLLGLVVMLAGSSAIEAIAGRVPPLVSVGIICFAFGLILFSLKSDDFGSLTVGIPVMVSVYYFSVGRWSEGVITSCLSIGMLIRWTMTARPDKSDKSGSDGASRSRLH
jgi:hypothetical protein